MPVSVMLLAVAFSLFTDDGPLVGQRASITNDNAVGRFGAHAVLSVDAYGARVLVRRSTPTETVGVHWHNELATVWAGEHATLGSSEPRAVPILGGSEGPFLAAAGGSVVMPSIAGAGRGQAVLRLDRVLPLTGGHVSGSEVVVSAAGATVPKVYSAYSRALGEGERVLVSWVDRRVTGADVVSVGGGGACLMSLSDNISSTCLRSSASGFHVRVMPDVDGDGVEDVVVVGGRLSGEGLFDFEGVPLRVFSGGEGEMVRSVDLTDAWVRTHDVVSVAVMGDVNGNGVRDFALGLREKRDAELGGVVVVDGGAGAVLATAVGDVSDLAFGSCVLALPDIDGDGVGDLAVGAPGVGSREVGFRGPVEGRVYLCSGGDLQGIEVLKGHGGNPGDRFGYDLDYVELTQSKQGGVLLVDAPGSRGVPSALHFFWLVDDK